MLFALSAASGLIACNFGETPMTWLPNWYESILTPPTDEFGLFDKAAGANIRLDIPAVLVSYAEGRRLRELPPGVPVNLKGQQRVRSPIHRISRHSICLLSRPLPL